MAELSHSGPAGLNLLTASEAHRRIEAGETSSEALVRDCLARIAARDPRIGAWAFVEPSLALQQARALDEEAGARGLRGPLHGIPVGVKDVLDTRDMPTEYGSAIHRGHRPGADSAVVAALRRAGAVILGKTRTTEFATPVPVGVKNPHDFGRSPGVSSSGSAAAVADFMAPLALGTQTGGSVILPAAFCGTVGYKASLDGLDRGGIRHLRPSLDTLGVFARSVEDVIALREALAPDRPAAVPAGDNPRIGLCRTPHWDQAAPETVSAVESAARDLAKAGAAVVDVDWPESFAGIEDAFRVISSVEGLRALEVEHRDHADRMNAWLRDGAAFARRCSDADHAAALHHAERCRADLAGIFAEVDFLLTASTVGEATDDLTGVSNSCFNRVWTLMHGPCITLPAYAGPNGLPVGIQLVGPIGADDDLLVAARWAWERLPAYSARHRS